MLADGVLGVPIAMPGTVPSPTEAVTCSWAGLWDCRTAGGSSGSSRPVGAGLALDGSCQELTGTWSTALRASSSRGHAGEEPVGRDRDVPPATGTRDGAVPGRSPRCAVGLLLASRSCSSSSSPGPGSPGCGRRPERSRWVSPDVPGSSPCSTSTLSLPSGSGAGGTGSSGSCCPAATCAAATP